MNMNAISYNHLFSIFIQVVLLSTVFVLFRSRPAMFLVAYILLSILPMKMYGGFLVDSETSFYALNSLISLLFLCIFVGYDFFVNKRNFKSVFIPIFLIFYAILSYLISISQLSYTMNFWWIITSYLLMPLLLKTENDLKLILSAYIISIFVFILKVLPLISSSEVYRGIVNLNPNYASFYLLTGVAVSLSIITKYKNLSFLFRAFIAIVLIMSIITMSFFASRTGFLMLLILLALYLFFNKKNFKIIIISVIIIGTVVMILNYFEFFENFILRFQEDDVITAGGRFTIQLELLKYYGESDMYRQLLGYGFLTSSNFGLGMQAHNTYVSILIGFGLVGLTVYLYYLFRLSINLVKSKNQYLLIIFLFLIFYGFALEPYHITEGVMLFCVLSGSTRIKLGLKGNRLA